MQPEEQKCQSIKRRHTTKSKTNQGKRKTITVNNEFPVTGLGELFRCTFHIVTFKRKVFETF